MHTTVTPAAPTHISTLWSLREIAGERKRLKTEEEVCLYFGAYILAEKLIVKQTFFNREGQGVTLSIFY